MNHPLISVAMCTYNGEKFLRGQMESIIKQTYKNLEIIVVDDGSTDNTVGIIEDYIKLDNRIKLIRNEHNLGFNKNFEKALALTSGQFIAISDQDDIWLEDKISLLLDHIKENWLIFSNSSYLDRSKRGKLLNNFKLPTSYKGLLLRNFVSGHTSLIRRELLNHALPFSQYGYYDWWLGFVASYHQKIVFFDEALTHYRVHGHSVVQSRLDAGHIQWQEFENTMSMLNAFSEYKNLKAQDRVFICQLRDAYRLRGEKKKSGRLVEIIVKNYKELFPNRKKWKVLTKHIFARRFSKGVNSYA